MRASADDALAVVLIVFPFFRLRRPTVDQAKSVKTIVNVLRSEKQSAQLQQGCHAVPRRFFRRCRGVIKTSASPANSYSRSHHTVCTDRGISEAARCSWDGRYG